MCTSKYAMIFEQLFVFQQQNFWSLPPLLAFLLSSSLAAWAHCLRQSQTEASAAAPATAGY